MIKLNKDEKRVITVLMDGSEGVIARTTFSSHERGTKQSEILKQVQDDKEGDRFAHLIPSGVEGLAMTNGRIDVLLAGENASVEVMGLVIGTGNDVWELDANIVHAAPNTKSNVNVRSVLRDRSTFAFRGNVKIEKGAKGADAYLRSDALLFDDAKMGDDTPALEILEPDVKAGHAATIGKVDEQMIFYLMSRGLTRNQSEAMIIGGFVNPIREILEKGDSLSLRKVVPSSKI